MQPIVEQIVLWHPVLGVEREFPATAQAQMAASGWVVKDAETTEEEAPRTFSAEESMALGAEDKSKPRRRAGTSNEE